MQLLDNMSTYEDRFRDNVQKRMMEYAVKNIPELATIKDIDTNRAATGGTIMTYSQYKETLIAAATRRDENLKPTSLRTKRVVQAATNDYGGPNSNWFDQGYLDAGEGYFGTFEENVTEIHRVMQENANDRVENSSRVPKEIWDKLSPDLQAMFREWNKKKAFLYRQKGLQRTVNSHDLTSYTGEDNTFGDDNGSGSMTDDMPINNNNPDDIPCLDNDSTAILAHITRQKILPSSHNVRNVLASAHKRTDYVNNHFAGQAKETQGKGSVIIDGKRYVQADKHKVLYKIASLEKTDGRVSSLID
jgi:hypothetical protein